MFLTEDTVHAFAKARHDRLGFPFLKENGELLSLANSSNMLVEPRALDHYKDFYAQATLFNEHYPQYFRFTLRICLDLEDLGVSGNAGAILCQYVRDNSLIDFDTSDTRRLETLNLLARRLTLNEAEIEHKSRLLDNIDRFIACPKSFSRMNKPFFYELTHIIFFLTDYGNQPWPLSESLLECLDYMGGLAFLDNDCDLLAEICVCYNYLNIACPDFWSQIVDENLAKLVIRYDTDIKSTLNQSTDEYHPYIVMNWQKAQKIQPCFTEKFRGRKPNFILEGQDSSILSKLSAAIHKINFDKCSPLLAQEYFLTSLTQSESQALTKFKSMGLSANRVLNGYGAESIIFN